MATVASTAPTSPPVAPRRSAAPVIARRWLRKLGFAFAVAVIVSPAILVFLWMLSLSLKNELANSTYPPIFIPAPPTLANYTQVFAENNAQEFAARSSLQHGASRPTRPACDRSDQRRSGRTSA